MSLLRKAAVLLARFFAPQNDKCLLPHAAIFCTQMTEDLRRFFIDPAALADERVTITGDLAHRLAKVLRYRVGDSLVLTAGGDTEYIARLDSVSSKSITATITGERPAPAEASVEVIVYQSNIRANRFDLVIEKGTEIGVARFVPIIAARTQLQEEASKARAERWQRLITEAAEQCGRGHLPTISETLPFEQAIHSAPGLKLMPYESERDLRLSDYLRSVKTPPSAVSIFIGPEGGWEENEVALAGECGATLVTLGRRVMRAETAAVVAAGIVLHETDRFKA
jgi:16S rRNA (uracil1498-N3)-methyltransferase